MDINKYAVASIALILVIYILRNTSILYGLSYYIMPSIISLLVFTITRNYISSVSSNKVATQLLYTLTIFMSLYYFLGIVFGFGINTISLDPLTYVSYTLLSITYVLALESLRSILLNAYVSTSIRYRFSKLMLISLAMLLLTIPYIKLVGFKLLYMPEFLTGYALNILLSIIFLKYGYKTTVLYHTIYLAATSLLPILPALPWYMDRLIIPLFILVQLDIILATSVYSKKGESVNFMKSRGYYVAKLFNTLFIVVIAMLFILMASGYHFFVIVSGSMQPTINVGDIVVVEGDSNITNGDIVAFIEAKNIIVHRIVKTTIENGKILYSTKGDANKNIDPWLIEDKNIIGKLKYTIPLIGYPIVFFIAGIGDYITSILFLITTILFTYIIYVTKHLV